MHATHIFLELYPLTHERLCSLPASVLFRVGNAYMFKKYCLALFEIFRSILALEIKNKQELNNQHCILM